MATMKDIAKQAGVSRGTVDRVLNNRGHVNPDTERIIREIATELKYSPIWGNYSKGETEKGTGLSANKPDSSTARQLI